jgi:geranylgeranyl reductase family protein
VSTEQDADVIVIGGGPGGAATAFHLARHGAKVLILEKSEYPREKVCGDGLTPRAVKQIVGMGVDTTAKGWARNRGLRVIGGGIRLELDWPDLASFPDYGLTRTRMDFDELLVQKAIEAGADLHTSTTAIAPVYDDRTQRVLGVEATRGAGKEPRTYRAPLVVAADGVSGRFPLSMGLTKRTDRPIGVAVRRYYRSPRHDDEYLESWLELRGRDDYSKLLPGYGWIFGMGDGRVNVGLGVLNSSVEFGKSNYREMLVDWMGATPEDWGMTEENADGPISGAALPMGFNRVPHYTRGVMLVGDSGGMVNPFNGEGIAYAMESGALAAEVAVQALAEADPVRRERTLQHYPAELKSRYGGYYRLGGWFVKLIGRPEIMRFATKHGMPHPALMRFVLKLLANLTDQRGGDATDRVINAMSRAVPAV